MPVGEGSLGGKRLQKKAWVYLVVVVGLGQAAGSMIYLVEEEDLVEEEQDRLFMVEQVEDAVSMIYLVEEAR